MYNRYVVYLVNIAAQKVDDTDTAKEIVQDVFLSFYLRKQELETVSSLKAYLYTALRNKIYSHYRKVLTRRKYELQAQNNLSVVTNNLHEEHEAKELKQILDEKINELPAQCRKVFLMSREEQLTHKEIAEQLNISPNTVDQHIQKALRILRATAGGMLLVEWWMRNL